MTALVTAIIKPHMLESVRTALAESGIGGMTVTEVMGYGRQGGHSETFRGTEYRIEFRPKVKVEVLVESDRAELLSQVIADAARTGKVGDGKVWAVEVAAPLRVRTGERGDDAI